LGFTREGLADPDDTSGYSNFGNGAVGQAQRLWRWDPWVRAQLFQQALVGPSLEFHPSGSDQLILKLHGADLLVLQRPSDALFRKQVADVMSYATLRQERSAEILSQIDGQWPFWAAVFPVPMAQLQKTQELIAAVTQMAVVVEMQFKHHFACRRPQEWSAQIQPMITTPGHGSFPMGHATQVFAVAVVLKALLQEAGGKSLPGPWLTQMDRLAIRISENRIVAGVHFPVDLAGGAVLGGVLGRLAVARLLGSGMPQPQKACWMKGDWSAFDFTGLDEHLAPQPAVTPASTNALTVGHSPILAALWGKCLDELRIAMA
jgi:hypothetical protein